MMQTVLILKYSLKIVNELVFNIKNSVLSKKKKL